MGDLTYLTRADVRSLLPGWTEMVDLVDETYAAMADGGVELPPKPGIHPRPDSFIHAMPAYLRGRDVAAVKWVSGYPANKELGLPYITGLLVLNDAATGLPRCVMDAAEITAVRTAAASGACVRRWAPDGWSRAAILGFGEQGRFHSLRNRSAGTNVVAGVTPGKGGTDVEGVPVFDTVLEAVAATEANTSVIYVPARFAADAVLEAADAGVALVVAITEGIPVADMGRVASYLGGRSTVLIGPDGKVRKHWKRVPKAEDHPAKVLEELG